MARTSSNREVVFEGKRKVYVRATAHFRFSIRVKASTFSLSLKNLTHEHASIVVMLAALGCQKKTILAPRTGRLRIQLGDTHAKASGIEWLALRMAGGDRPMVLKAPGLFRNKMIVIDPGQQPGRYLMTLVDPDTDQRHTVEASELAVQAAITTFQ